MNQKEHGLFIDAVIYFYESFKGLFSKKPTKKNLWQETLDFEAELKVDFDKCQTDEDLDAAMLKAYNFMTSERDIPSNDKTLNQMSADEFVGTDAIHLFRIQKCCHFDGGKAYHRIHGVENEL